MAKDPEILAHEVTFLTAEHRTLRRANEALSKRQRAKRARIGKRRALFVEEPRRSILGMSLRRLRCSYPGEGLSGGNLGHISVKNSVSLSHLVKFLAPYIVLRKSFDYPQ